MKLLKQPVNEQSSEPFNPTLISTKLDIPPLKTKRLHHSYLLHCLAKSRERRRVLIFAASPPSGVSTHFLATVLTACGIGAGVIKDQPGNNRLTGRDLEVLTLMVRGFKNREIAETAFVSVNTVKTHVKHIYEKLHVETRVQAIRRVEEWNLLSD